MGGFKLLAIVPLHNCGKSLIKSLEPGQVYQFYKNYKISISSDETKILSAKKISGIVPEDLYDLENGIKLNISAVVGENGSGKSSLFEVMYYLIYQIFISLKVNDEYILEPKSKELEQRISNIETDIRIQKIDELLNKGKHYDDSIELRVAELINEYSLYSLRSSNRTGPDLQRELLKQLSDTKEILKKNLKLELEIEDELTKNLAASVVFETENNIYELSYSDSRFRYNQFIETSKKPMNLSSLDVIELSKLFYTISINYSAHSLNSRSIGNWISRLFHKNDAYLTPLVINPMRTEGNFDINKELHLSKERLLSNIIYDHFNQDSVLILEKYRVDEVIFTVKSNYKFVQPISFSQDYFSGNIVGSLIQSFIGENKEINLLPFHERALAYLDKKIEKIKENYGFLIFGKDSDKAPDLTLLKFLLLDDSHITKKVKQTLNFIKFSQEDQDFWIFDDSGNCTFTFETMIKWIEFCITNPKDLPPYKLIEYCFPGYFDVSFNFSKVGEENIDQRSRIDLEKMSSGELQMILNINSIQYHLHNLQSVHDKTKEKIDSKTRVKYQYVNIVLDEIELYYHPDMQRQMVKNIRKSIERIKSKGKAGISAINICFLTHSPFILSDIPNENVLRLNPEKTDVKLNEEETFAANIQDILGNGFFMKVLIGEFAFEKLIKVFNNLNTNRSEHSISEAEEILKYIGDPLIRNQLKKIIDDKS